MVVQKKLNLRITVIIHDRNYSKLLRWSDFIVNMTFNLPSTSLLQPTQMVTIL